MGAARLEKVPIRGESNLFRQQELFDACSSERLGPMPHGLGQGRVDAMAGQGV